VRLGLNVVGQPVEELLCAFRSLSRANLDQSDLRVAKIISNQWQTRLHLSLAEISAQK
jgi:hypothetical protein